MTAPRAVLVIDDDPEMGWVLASALAGAGWGATVVSSGAEALAWVLAAVLADAGWGATVVDGGGKPQAFLPKNAFPLAFLDARLPDMNGMELARELRRVRPGMRIVMISGYFFADDVEVADAIKESRIDGFLAKPFDLDAISAMLVTVPAWE